MAKKRSKGRTLYTGAFNQSWVGGGGGLRDADNIIYRLRTGTTSPNLPFTTVKCITDITLSCYKIKKKLDILPNWTKCLPRIRRRVKKKLSLCTYLIRPIIKPRRCDIIYSFNSGYCKLRLFFQFRAVFFHFNKSRVTSQSGYLLPFKLYFVGEWFRDVL